MRVCAPRADEDGADGGRVEEVVGEGVAHGFCVAREGEVVGMHAGGDEGVDCGEGVGGDDVDGAEGGGDLEGSLAAGCGGGVVGWVFGGVGM